MGPVFQACLWLKIGTAVLVDPEIALGPTTVQVCNVVVDGLWDPCRACDGLELTPEQEFPLYLLAIHHPDPRVRSWSVRHICSLVQIYLNEKGQVVAPALVEALADSDSTVREDAREGLEQIGPFAQAGLPRLLAMIQASSDPTFRKSAIGSLVEIGQEHFVRGPRVVTVDFGVGPLVPAVIQALLDALRDPNPGVRKQAAALLGEVGPQRDTVIPTLIQALRDGVAPVRRAAAKSLGELGQEANRAAPILIALLWDRDWAVCIAAAKALYQVGGRSERAIEVLIDSLSKSTVRKRAVEALVCIGPDGKEAIPALTELLKARSVSLRLAAAEALWSVGEVYEPSLPILIRAVQSKKPRAVCDSCRLIGYFGPKGRAAIPALLALLQDTQSGCSMCAEKALGKMGPEAYAAIPVLVKCLEKENLTLYHALQILGRIGPGARAAVPQLTGLLQHRAIAVRIFAASALLKIDRQNKEAKSALIKVLRTEPLTTEDDFFRFFRGSLTVLAAHCLAELGADARDALPEIKDLLQKVSGGGHVALALDIWQIEKETADILPVLRAALHDEDAGVCISAAQVLGTIGPSAKAAVPWLMEALGDGDPGVREEAADALMKIDPTGTWTTYR